MSGDFISQFYDHLHSLDLGVVRKSDIVPDGVSRLVATSSGRGAPSKNLYVQLTVENDRAWGRWNSRARGDWGTWSSKADRAWTPEEREAWKAKREEDKKAAEAERQAEADRVAVDVRAVWDAAGQAQVHGYCKRKKCGLHGVRVGTDTYGREGVLMIPYRLPDGTLRAMQSIDDAGEKLYHGSVKGAACLLGRAGPVMLVCEGYATGASLHEALGLPVLVAGDTGNLEAVARAWKADGRCLIIAADNDQWVFKAPRAAAVREIDRHAVAGDDPRWAEWREAGYCYNPGIEAAQRAAKAVDGLVIWPDIAPDCAAKLTDWNDKRVRDGISAVAQAFLPVIAQARPAGSSSPKEPSGKDRASPPPPPSHEAGPIPLGDDMAGMVMDQNDVEGDGGLPFFTLGFNDGEYYYYPIRTMQIVALTPAGHTLNNLLQLANLGEWQDNPLFAKCRPNEIALYAWNWLSSRAHEIGIFKPDERIRGRGIWVDDGRIVYHAGNVLYVDGVRTKIVEFKSWYVYVQSYRMTEPGTDALSNKDAHKLRVICESFSWERRLSGSLLAGWIVISFLCALLRWRPHIWITGESGSGKSTCKNLIYDILGDVSFKFDGMSTEPSMRAKMRRDALPLLIDEMEAETQAQKTRVGSILELCRNASSGATVEKFGQEPFAARFCAGMFSINPPVSQTADKRRISMMVLKTNRAADADEQYQKLCDMIAETITPEWRMRLINRIVSNTDAILANIKTFNTAARKVLKNAGAADQVAPMLAGLYLLGSTDEITTESAEEFMRSHEWDDHTTISEQSDPQKLLYRITTSTIDYEPSSGTRKMSTVGELILAASGRGKDELIDVKIADKRLRQYGIKVSGQSVFFANRNQNLGRLLRDTPWSTGEEGWARTMGDITGAEKPKSPTSFAPGTPNQRYVSVPIMVFLNDDTPMVQSSMIDGPEDMGEEIPW